MSLTHRLLTPLLLLAAALPLSARTEDAPAASLVVADAFAKAKMEKKVAMVAFHASWCGWCHKMDSVMKRPEIKPIFDKYFVVTWLTVMEGPDKKNLENAGGDELMKANGGEGQGIPYFYFANPSSQKTIVTSKRPATATDKGGNVGCPAEPFEIAYFLDMVKKAVPRISPAELKTLEAGFKTVKGGG
ncbi:MAG: thioredoxin family protein [Armatimonadetes bacterium]|nr:thioredoxin family protein [Armatimonadota bacterium]